MRFITGIVLALLSTAIAHPVIAEPEVNSVEPQQGPADESNVVTLFGEGFEPGMTVGLLGGGPYQASFTVLATRRGCPGGESDVAALGSTVYITANGSLHVLDASDPRMPEVIESTGIAADRVVVSGEFGYVVGNGGFQVLDLAVPEAPEPVGILPGYDTRWAELVVVGNHAYAVSTDGDQGYIDVLNLSDPVSPILVTTVTVAGGLTDATSWGEYLYATGDDALHVLSLTVISDPVLVSELPVGFGANSIESAAGILFVAGDGLAVFDATTTPAAPQQIATEVGEGGSDISISGGTAIVLQEESARILDVTSPSSPTRLGAVQTAHGSTDIDLSGSLAFISTLSCEGPKGSGRGRSQHIGLEIIDFGNRPPQPEIHSTVTTGPANRLLLDDERAYACVPDGVDVFDVPVSGDPIRTGGLAIACPDQIEAGRSYRRESGSLEVFDVNDPTAVSQMPSIPILSSFWTVNGLTLSTIRSYSTLHIHCEPPFTGNPGDLAEPQTDTVCPPGWSGHDYWFGNCQLLNQDVSDPAAPLSLANLEFPHHYLHSAVQIGETTLRMQMDYMYLYYEVNSTCGGYGPCPLWMGYAPTTVFIDIADPSNPVVVAGPPECHQPSAGGDGDHGLSVFACRDDGTMAPVSRYWDPGSQLGGLIGDRMVLNSPARNQLRVIDPGPPVDLLRVSASQEADIELAPGLPFGPYDLVTTTTSGSSEELRGGYHVCPERDLSARLEPVLQIEHSNPSELGEIEGTRVPWRLAVTGDDLFFDETDSLHRAVLTLPELPTTLEMQFEPRDGSGGMALELLLEPQMDSGVVVFIGDNPAPITAIWEEIMSVGGCAMPRLDDHTYGDVILRVFPTPGLRSPQWEPIGGTSREIGWPPSAPIRYRYDFAADGILTEARVWGPDVDLVIDVSAEDKYRCQYGEEISFVETLREYCEALATTNPGLLLDCNKWSE